MERKVAGITIALRAQVEMEKRKHCISEGKKEEVTLYSNANERNARYCSTINRNKKKLEASFYKDTRQRKIMNDTKGKGCSPTRLTLQQSVYSEKKEKVRESQKKT